MNKKQIIIVGVITVLALFIGIITIAVQLKNPNIDKGEKELIGTVMSYNNGIVMIQSEDSTIYSCKALDQEFVIGDNIAIKYTGLDEKNYAIQNCEVISYEVISDENDANGIPLTWLDDGIFKEYYKMAYDKLNKLTIDEKIGQLLLARYPEETAIEDLKKYYLSGFVFYEKDFKDKSMQEVKTMINTLQNYSNIPLLTAVDEEGGKVVRVSSNNNLSENPFKSPSDLYKEGGIDMIKEDTQNKSKILYNLGLNLNLAPVVDVSTDPTDYIYSRTIQENTKVTAEYAKAVIESSRNTGVSYTLKHFPGYAGNADTHKGGSQDTRSYEDIVEEDLPPFKSGIDSGAEAVLVSHNMVSSIDSENPASLSANVHNILRKTLGFTGIVLTDDIAMDALDGIEDATVKAVLAGNEIVITTDYVKSFNEIKSALMNGTISENQIDKSVFKVLAWKYYKMIMQEQSK